MMKRCKTFGAIALTIAIIAVAPCRSLGDEPRSALLDEATVSAALRQGDCDTAREGISAGIEQGLAWAFSLAGELYAGTSGCASVDVAKSFSHFRRAVDAGYDAARRPLLRMYAFGIGVAQSYPEAGKLLDPQRLLPWPDDRVPVSQDDQFIQGCLATFKLQSEPDSGKPDVPFPRIRDPGSAPPVKIVWRVDLGKREWDVDTLDAMPTSGRTRSLTAAELDQYVASTRPWIERAVRYMPPCFRSDGKAVVVLLPFILRVD